MKLEVNMVGGEPPPGQVPSEARASQVVTRQQAEAKAKEAEGAFSVLMDQIEASRETQGDYFIKFGEKEENGADNRALLFMASSQAEYPGTGRRVETAVAVTRDGPAAATDVHGTSLNSVSLDSVRELSNQEGAILKKGERLQTGLIPLTIEQDVRVQLELRLNTIQNPQLAEQLTASAIEKSIVAVEAPHKHNLEQAQQKLNVANSLSSKISTLPPKA